MSIRLLTDKDVPLFKQLRLTVLQSNPDSFLSTYEYESTQFDHFFLYTLMSGYEPPHFGYFGYFEKDKLVGYIQLTRPALPKQYHTTQIFNLSVSPEYRGKGIARQLMTTALDHAKQAGIEQAYLSCLSSNIPAQKLYESMGFNLSGSRPKAILWNGKYQDKLFYTKSIDNN